MTKNTYSLVVFRSVTHYQDPANAQKIEEADMVVIVPKYPGRWSEVKTPLLDSLAKLGYVVELREIGGTL